MLPLLDNIWEEVMDIYTSWDFEAKKKSDNSPLTRADLASHIMLNEGLPTIIDAPILSEEGPPIEQKIKEKLWSYWLVDPIDGTKSFMYKSGNFCICVAFMVNHRPVYSAIYDPKNKIFYSAKQDKWSIKRQKGKREKLKTGAAQTNPYRFINSEPKAYQKTTEQLQSLHSTVQQKRVFSALKFCLMAEDEWELFAQNRSTHHRDTAAGELIARESWLLVNSTHEWLITEGINYNTPTTLNNSFMVHKPWAVSEKIMEAFLLKPTRLN